MWGQSPQDSHLVAEEGQTPEEGHQHQIQNGDLLVSLLPSECLTLLFNYQHGSSQSARVRD